MKAAGAGIEPTSRRSKRPVLPLDDPASFSRRGRLMSLPIGYGPAQVEGERVEPLATSDRHQSGRPDLNRRSRAPGARGIPDFPTSWKVTPFTRAPSGSRTRASASARQQAAVTSWALGWKPNCQRPLEHREGLEPSSPQYGCGVWAARLPVPSVSGTGGYRAHIVRFKKPVHYPVCHSPKSIGAMGVEPTTYVL